jgi:TPR repeat protein
LAGVPEAQFSLAFAFDTGDSIPSNTNEAIRFYTLSAQQGHAPAQNNLGVLYATGHKNKTEKNLKLAFRWYKAAAENGSAVGQFHIALLSLNEEAGFKPNPEYAYQMLKRSARQHYTMAQAMLGTAYLEGKICEPDLVKGIKLLKKAAEAEDPVALHNLGIAHKKGTGVTSDADKAQAYFELAKSSKTAKLFDALNADELGSEYIHYS